MANQPKIVLFLGLNDILNSNFEHLLHDGLFNRENHFQLVHILDHDRLDGLPPQIDRESEKDIEAFIHEKFDSVVQKLWGHNLDQQGQNVEKAILFHKEPKLRAINYLKEEKADSCIVVTRGDQGVEGVFKDSFAYYLVAHAPCDVLVLRPDKA